VLRDGKTLNPKAGTFTKTAPIEFGIAVQSTDIAEEFFAGEVYYGFLERKLLVIK
jgi:hypothetical protein